MSLLFFLVNNTFVPAIIDGVTQSQTLPLNYTFIYQPLAPNAQPQGGLFMQNFNQNITNTTDSTSQLRFQKQKRPKKREKNFQRELVSAKKNGQSNIINSYFSFILSRLHSEGFVRRMVRSYKKPQIESQKIISVFYLIMRVVNLRRARRYINKVILWDFFTIEKLQMMFENFQTMSVLTLQEASSLLRKCFLYYLREVSLTSILTSKRIPLHSKQIHLQKRRIMRSFVCQEDDNQS